MEKIAKIVESMNFRIEEIEDNLNDTMYVVIAEGVGIGFIYSDKNYKIALPDTTDKELINRVNNLEMYLSFVKDNNDLEQINNDDNTFEFLLMRYKQSFITISLKENSKIYKSYIVSENGEVYTREYDDEKVAIKHFILETKALDAEELKVEVTLKSKLIDKGINLLNNMKK